MDNKCYSCDKEALILVKAEFFTIYPASGDPPAMVEHKICLPCLQDTIEYISDCERRK